MRDSQKTPPLAMIVGVICVVFGFFGGLAVFFSFLSLSNNNAVILSVFQQFPAAVRPEERTFILAAVTAFVFLWMMTGVGILKRWNWARLFFLVFAGINMISSVTVIYAGVVLRGIFFLLVWGGLFFYFSRPHIRKLYSNGSHRG